jgi:crotonobetainyl-CoA:carnitine CoA-transferase CaiB-like acyl-CoA transferase
VVAVVAREPVLAPARSEEARSEGGPALRALTFAERGEILRALSRAIHGHRDALIEIAIKNGGNTRSDAKYDIDGASGTLAYSAELGRELGGYFAEHPFSHWAERLGENDVPFAPINSVDKVVEDPQVRHLGIVVPVQRAHGGAAAVRPPIQFDGERADSVLTAPLLDEHGAAIRAALARGQDWPEES